MLGIIEVGIKLICSHIFHRNLDRNENFSNIYIYGNRNIIIDFWVSSSDASLK